MKGNGKFILLSVNEAEQKKIPADISVKKGSRWQLTTRGENLLDLLTL